MLTQAPGVVTPIRTTVWQLRSHPQETNENVVDLGHLGVIHGYESLDIEQPFSDKAAPAGRSFERVELHGRKLSEVFGGVEAIRPAVRPTVAPKKECWGFPRGLWPLRLLHIVARWRWQSCGAGAWGWSRLQARRTARKHYHKRCLPGWYIYCSMFSPIIMYVLLLAHRMLGILSDSRDRACVAASTFTISFDCELSPGEGQIGQGCGAVAAAVP